MQTPVDASNRADSRAHKLVERALDETRRFVMMFLYLWILFGLFVLNEVIILRARGMDFSAQGFALINALILAKVMLIAEDLNLDRWLRGRPLIYPILYESFLLTVLFLCFHVVEKVVVGLFKGASAMESLPAIGGGGLAGLACVATILFVALIPFFAFRHISRVLGTSRMKAMLFGTAVATGDAKPGEEQRLR